MLDRVMEAAILTLLTLFVAVIGVLVFFYSRVNFWAKKGIPHLAFLPLLGNNLSIFLGQKSGYDFISGVYNSFPNARYLGIMDFNTPVAVLRDPELIKEICVKNFDNFLDHQSFLDAEIDPLFGKSVSFLKGDRWKVMRNTLSPSFTASKMKFIFELIAKCSRDFVQYFIDHPNEAKFIETKDAFTRYTNDVIATTAFGISINSMRNRDNEFYRRGKDATSFLSIFRMIKFLGFRACPKIMKLLGFSFFSRATYKFFTSVIQNVVKTREEKKIFRPDMLQLLIEARNKDSGVELSIEDITAQAFVFFFAGFDPSATLMCFVAHELAMNPEIQEKLRNEVDSLTKIEGSDFSYETLQQMRYLDRVILETLRKYPPTAATDRECVKKFTLPKPTAESKEYTAEPKSLIWIPIYALHHDPKYFPDPEKFDPERFNDINKNINSYAYVPFGVGPRKCIGNRFALMETKILFVHILQNFVLEKCEKTKHPIELEKTIVISIKGGSWVKLTKRYL